MGRAIDSFITAGNLDGLLNLVVVLVIVYLSAGTSSVIQGQIMVGVGQNFVAGLRSRLFSHIQTLSMAYHDHHQVGDLMSRVSNDTDAINQAISDGLIEFTSNILLLGGIMIAMFLLNWQLALGTATLLPIMLAIMLAITVWVTLYSRKAFREVQTNLGNLIVLWKKTSLAFGLSKPSRRKKLLLRSFTSPMDNIDKRAFAPT